MLKSSRRRIDGSDGLPKPILVDSSTVSARGAPDAPIRGQKYRNGVFITIGLAAISEYFLFGGGAVWNGMGHL
jgi:hypothetical protein